MRHRLEARPGEPADNRPVVLLGHSLGGQIMARVAAENPGQVTALELLAASLGPAQEGIHPMQRVGASTAVSPMLPRALRNANTELMALAPELQALGTMQPPIVGKVIVHGTRDDFVPVANVASMQALLTGASCVNTTLLDGRNHALPWNSEAEVREAIHDALDPAC